MKKAAVIYVDGMTDADMVEDFVIRPLLKNKCEKTKFDLGNDTERKVDTFGDDALKRFDAGLGVGVALEFGRIIAGLDGQFGLVDVQKLGNPKNMNFSIVVGYKF